MTAQAAPTLKMTSAEFLEWKERPENRERLYELIDGEIVEKVGSFLPASIAATIIFYLKLYLQSHPIGHVTSSEGTYLLSDDFNPMPDVGYISRARLTEIPPREAPMAPDLAVEVKSPTDTLREQRRKAERYIALGTALVWLVLPEQQLVEVYAPGQDVQIITRDGTLDGGAVLPGFSLPVADIFAI